jgi:hypothetical protein
MAVNANVAWGMDVALQLRSFYNAVVFSACFVASW